ncbi:unnamed protein product [Gemmata massiliana]|uniref:Uncharacterized protein n=1 Tax=Gemmata massiliana TaxID=1210884 RepID=A0A6P2D2Y1_9BACT|nr:unnamed protein product [Gemmata massiliana]
MFLGLEGWKVLSAVWANSRRNALGGEVKKQRLPILNGAMMPKIPTELVSDPLIQHLNDLIEKSRVLSGQMRILIEEMKALRLQNALSREAFLPPDAAK